MVILTESGVAWTKAWMLGPEGLDSIAWPNWNDSQFFMFSKPVAPNWLYEYSLLRPLRNVMDIVRLDQMT